MHRRTELANDAAPSSPPTVRLREQMSQLGSTVQLDETVNNPLTVPIWHVRSRSSQALLTLELDVHHRHLWNRSPIGYVVVDRFGSIIKSNGAARRLLGLSGSRSDSVILSACFAGGREAELSDFLRQVFSGKVDSSFDGIAPSATDANQPAHVRLVGVSVGSLTSTLAITDVTELVRESEQRQQLEERLAQLQRLELVHMMSAGIAHDFKNIVQVIESYAAVLNGQSTSPSASTIAQEIMTAAARGASLANRWLAYSRYGQLCKQSVEIVRLFGGA